MFLLGAIPAVVAILLVTPLLMQQDIPFSAAVPNDNIEIEYTVHDLRTVSFGVAERVGADRTNILTLERDGDVTLLVTEQGYAQPAIRSSLGEEEVVRIIAMVKETGFMTMPEDPFPGRENATEYKRHTVQVTLNGAVTKISWPEQAATDRFIPPIITHIEEKLGEVVERMRN